MKHIIFKWMILSCSIGVGFVESGCQDITEQGLRRKSQVRNEFESAYEHFLLEKDTFKIAAAKFLLDNSREKYFYRGDKLDHFINFLDSISASYTSVEDFRADLSGYYSKNASLVGDPTMILDTEVVTKEFIIQNISAAVEAFRNLPVNKNIAFDDFCEYVLPYRVGNEALENTRDSLRLKFYRPDFKIAQKSSEIANSILSSCNKMTIISPFPDFVPDFPVSTLFKLKAGTCRESSNLGIQIMRSVGLPVAMDFTPQWPHRSLGHTWSSLIISRDSCIDFEGSSSEQIGGHLRALKSFRMAKAFRKTFSPQKESLALNHGEEDS